MNTYDLTRRSDGRIILALSHLSTDAVLQTIVAKDWVSARIEVDEKPFYNTQGHGWLEK